jgi:hypothetical protein
VLAWAEAIAHELRSARRGEGRGWLLDLIGSELAGDRVPSRAPRARGQCVPICEEIIMKSHIYVDCPACGGEATAQPAADAGPGEGAAPHAPPQGGVDLPGPTARPEEGQLWEIRRDSGHRILGPWLAVGDFLL